MSQQSNPRIPIVLADDHPLFLHGLSDTVRMDQRFEIVGQAKDGHQALELILQHRPQLAVLDIDMPKLTGLQVAREVVKQRIETDIVILTMHEDREHFEAAMECGALGYVLKDSAAENILQCFETVLRGRTYVSPILADHLLSKRRDSGRSADPSLNVTALTVTERKILKLISQSKSTKTIAEELFISTKTVSAHRSNICEKLNLRGTNALLKFALEHKHRL